MADSTVVILKKHKYKTKYIYRLSFSKKPERLEGLFLNKGDLQYKIIGITSRIKSSEQVQEMFYKDIENSIFDCLLEAVNTIEYPNIGEQLYFKSS